MEINKSINFLKQIDDYLLINAPVFWATKIHYLLAYGAIWFAVIYSATLKLSVRFGEVQNTEHYMLLLCFFSISFYFWWGTKSRILAYRRLYGVTGKAYFLKALLTSYFVLFIIGIIFVTPYSNYKRRLVDRYWDKSLPSLRLEDFKSTISSSVYYFNHPKEDFFDYRKKSIDQQIDFSSSISDTIHSFRRSSAKLLKDLDLLEVYFFNSGLGVDSLVLNVNKDNVRIFFNKKSSPHFSNTIHELNLKNFRETVIKSSLYPQKKITLLEYQALSKDHKIKTSIPIFIYKNSSNYRYCDKMSLQGSLLIDEMLSSIGDVPVKERLEKLDVMVRDLQPLETASYNYFIIALAICVAFTYFIFLAQFIGIDFLAVPIFNTMLIVSGLVIFLPSFGQYFINNLWILPLTTISCSAIVYMQSQRRYKSRLSVGITIFAALIPLAMVIVMAVTKVNTDFETAPSLNLRFFDLLYNNHALSISVAGFLLILLPWFLATRIYTLSVLPNK